MPLHVTYGTWCTKTPQRIKIYLRFAYYTALTQCKTMQEHVELLPNPAPPLAGGFLREIIYGTLGIEPASS